MILIRWLVGALVIMLVPYIVPGISVDGLSAALLVALVLGLANALVRPMLIFLTLPITILSLGLFILVINAFLFMITARLVPGFSVDSFSAAFFGSIVMAIIGWGVNLIFGDKKAVVV